MNEVLKFITSLLKQGFATEADRSKLAKMIKNLDEDGQEAVAGQAEQVADLPEEDPETPAEDGDDVSDEEVEKSVEKLFRKSVNEIKSEIKDYMTEFKDQMVAKAGIYNPDVQEKRKQTNGLLRKTLSAVLANDTVALKELTTDATGSPYGGYVVDAELSAEIRHLITEYGVARREMMNVSLSQGSYKANNLVTDVTVYWVDEGAVINSTQAVLGQEELTLKKLGAIATMTNELIADEEIDLMSFVASRVAEKFAEAEDLAFFTGDGTASFGSFTGLLNATDVNEVTMGSTLTAFTDLTAEDLIDMVDATPQGALSGAKFFMHRTIMSIVRKLREDSVSASDGAGAFIYQAPSQSGPATIWGYPVVLVEAMPAVGDTAVDTSFVLFGDLRRACIFGNKGGIEVAQSNSAVVRNVADNADINTFTTDRQAVRWTERVGYIRIIPTAVTKLTTAAA